MVERNLAKVEVASSRLVSRSNFKTGSHGFPFLSEQQKYVLADCRHGAIAKRLCNGLQIRLAGFDSRSRLQPLPCSLTAPHCRGLQGAYGLVPRGYSGPCPGQQRPGAVADARTARRGASEHRRIDARDRCGAGRAVAGVVRRRSSPAPSSEAAPAGRCAGTAPSAAWWRWPSGSCACSARACATRTDAR